MKKNILISTLGGTWDIIPETLGAFFYKEGVLDFYGNDPEQSVKDFRLAAKKNLDSEEIDELWLISTDQKGSERSLSVEDMLKNITNWCNSYDPATNLVIRTFVLHGIKDIDSKENVKHFHNLALLVLFNSKLYANGGKRIVSLACGRKTMSADIQDAAYCFGCDMMMHVNALNNARDIWDSQKIRLNENGCKAIFPVELKPFPASDLFNEWYDSEIANQYYLFKDEKTWISIQPSISFLKKVEEKREAARHFYSSYWSNQQYSYDNFPILYTLSLETQKNLKNFMVGTCPELRQKELRLMQDLPKADLHCHLGGVLSIEELIEVAETLEPEIAELRRTNQKLEAWNFAPPEPDEKWKAWRSRIAKELDIPEAYVAPAFILHYKDDTPKLDEIVYGPSYNKGRDFRKEDVFVSVAEEGENGISTYEELGDLQGTSLLKHEATLRKTLQILFRNAQAHNLKYLEIRCSPLNYANGEFTKEKVLDAILDEMENAEKTMGIKLSLLFIASRHNEDYVITEGIDLYKEAKDNLRFRKFFRGFDVAGNEVAKQPGELRNVFTDVLRDCLNVTVHAGETMPAENIWQAVYDLSAERIGHGLTLAEKKDDLIPKFRDRRIGIEMCPSSNYQIVGYKDNYFPNQNYKEYPLKYFLQNHLRVCVNTDDPGISRTNMTNELLKAARLTRDGLSLWELFSLLYNSFDLAFLPYNQKIALLNEMNNQMKLWLDKNVAKIEAEKIYEE